MSYCFDCIMIICCQFSGTCHSFRNYSAFLKDPIFFRKGKFNNFIRLFHLLDWYYPFNSYLLLLFHFNLILPFEMKVYFLLNFQIFKFWANFLCLQCLHVTLILYWSIFSFEMISWYYFSHCLILLIEFP